MERQLPDELKSLRQGGIERDAPHPGKNKLANGSIADPLSVSVRRNPRRIPRQLPGQTVWGVVSEHQRQNGGRTWLHLVCLDVCSNT